MVIQASLDLAAAYGYGIAKIILLLMGIREHPML